MMGQVDLERYTRRGKKKKVDLCIFCMCAENVCSMSSLKAHNSLWSSIDTPHSAPHRHHPSYSECRGANRTTSSHPRCSSAPPPLPAAGWFWMIEQFEIGKITKNKNTARLLSYTSDPDPSTQTTLTPTFPP